MNNVNSIKKILMNTIYTNTARRVWTMSGVGVGWGGQMKKNHFGIGSVGVVS